MTNKMTITDANNVDDSTSNNTPVNLGPIVHMPHYNQWAHSREQLITFNNYKGRMDILFGICLVALMWYLNKYVNEHFDDNGNWIETKESPKK